MRAAGTDLLLSPSDVTGFLACEHLTTLSRRVAVGEMEPPPEQDEQTALIFRKGMEHERGFLETIRSEGTRIAEVAVSDGDWPRARAETEAAMEAGVDVVYQGVFADGSWRGVADFLLRVET